MPDDQKAGLKGAPADGDDAAKAALAGSQDEKPGGGDAGETESAEAELARLRKAHEQSVGEKGKLEQVSRELEELKRAEAARAAAASTIAPPNADAYAQQQLQQDQQDWANTQLLAQQGDPVARQSIRIANIIAAQNQYYSVELEAMKVPESYREDVKAALRTGKYRDHAAALEAVKGVKDLPAKDAEIDRLKRENESLKRAEEARKAGVVGAGRSVPDLSGAKGAEPRNETELNAELDRLERAGDFKTRSELSRRYRSMELPFQRAG